MLPVIPMEIKNEEDLKKYHETRRKYEENTIRLAEYEDTGLTPEQLREVDRLYEEKCKELTELQELLGKDYNKGCLINKNALIQSVQDLMDDENIDYQPYGFGWRLIERIKNQLTAYDVDKVVEQLEGYCDEAKQFGSDGMLADIIDVVKAGGKND